MTPARARTPRPSASPFSQVRERGRRGRPGEPAAESLKAKGEPLRGGGATGAATGTERDAGALGLVGVTGAVTLAGAGLTTLIGTGGTTLIGTGGTTFTGTGGALAGGAGGGDALAWKIWPQCLQRIG